MNDIQILIPIEQEQALRARLVALSDVELLLVLSSYTDASRAGRCGLEPTWTYAQEERDRRLKERHLP